MFRVADGVEVCCYVRPGFPLLHGKDARALPWVAEGVEILVGPKSAAVSSCCGRYGRRSRGVDNLFGTIRSAEAWTAPAWAQEGRVVVRVTVQAKNCM